MKAYHLAMILIIFNLAFAFLASTSFFPNETKIEKGQIIEAPTTEEALNDAIQMVGGGTLLGAILGSLAAILTRSLTPVGIGVFSGVFWGSFINTSTIIDNLLSTTGSFNMFFIIFSTISAFIFLASIIQMMTGGWATYD